ncbi:MAG TPA: wax ester/triacylglycerol synthase family O-acyltransferase [Rhodoblastus sp.]|nr:wax ester/triacylglycerol synthase family O-acyltransferase [Rhodoblastus sp.]
MSKAERMLPVDTAWLRMDRPNNLMMIMGVMALRGPVDVAALATALEERMLAHRRFRQRAVTSPAGAFWVDDRDFDIARHVQRVRLPGRGGEKALQAYVAQLASEPLDHNHPLWQMRIVEKYEGGVAIVSRIHHAVADGIALMQVMLGLADDGAEARPATHGGHHDEGWLSSLTAPVAEAASLGLNVTRGALREALALATNPLRAARLMKTGAGVAGELAWLLAMPSDSETRFKGKPHGAKRVAWTRPLRLHEVKAASAALDCSINDLLLACVAGALRGYLEDKGDETQSVEVRALAPINLRPPRAEHELGNRFGILAVELPIGMADPLERLDEIRRRMLKLKNSYEPPVTLGLFAALGLAPKIMQDQLFDLLISRASAVMTNVPGPQKEITIAGAPVTQVMFWVPQSGDIGMGVSILSYAGNVQFGLITDAALTPDPEAIIGRFEREFESYLYHVLLEAAAWADAREAEEAPPAAPAESTPQDASADDAPVMRKRKKRLRA